MSDDLIRRQDAIDAVKGRFSMPVDNLIVEVIGALPSAQQTIDAVEVVRCHKCCYWDRETIRYNSNDFKCWNEAVCRQHSIDGNEPHEMWVDADWFCADGEVKNDEQIR